MRTKRAGLVSLSFFSHRQEQQQKNPHHFQHTADTHLKERCLLGDDGCSEEDVRGFSSTPSFRLGLIGSKKCDQMDACKTAFRNSEASLSCPVVPIRLQQLLSDIEESAFLS